LKANIDDTGGSKKKIAIIGVNGQLGSDIHLCLKKDYDVVPLLHKDIEIADKDSVDSCLNKVNPDILVNTAAYNDLMKCEKYLDKAFSINGVGSRNLALWCKENDCFLVHISTDYVFDGKSKRPYVEDDSAWPLNTYGITKLVGEFYISSSIDNYAIIRTTGLYGTHPCRGKSSKNFVEMFLDLITNNETVQFGGDEICTPTFTENLAEQIRLIMDKNLKGVIHATNEGFCSWFEFGEEIIKQTNSSTRLTKAMTKADASLLIRPLYTVLENKRLKDNGINIMKDWKVALNDYLGKRGKV
jgi:dTDP-4-dehydrorhamnose reductase